MYSLEAAIAFFSAALLFHEFRVFLAFKLMQTPAKFHF